MNVPIDLYFWAYEEEKDLFGKELPDSNLFTSN